MPIGDRSILRLAVTGHRLNRISLALLDGLAPRLRQLLDVLADTANACRLEAAPSTSHTSAALVIISCLAEGADQYVARLGLGAGHALRVVLPFERGICASACGDAASREQFLKLLALACDVVEPDAAASTEEEAYRLAGQAVLDAADMLLAIWDGQEARGIGGTAEIVSEAISRGMVVIHISIDPQACDAVMTPSASEAGRAVRSEDFLVSIREELVRLFAARR